MNKSGNGHCKFVLFTGELEYIGKQQRPQSATSKAVERKVFSLHVGISETGESGEEDGDSEDDDPLDNYLTYEDDDFDVSLMIKLKLIFHCDINSFSSV